MFELIVKVALALLLPATGWAHARLLDHGDRLLRIESTRWTAEDARTAAGETRAEMRADLTALRAQLEANTQLLQRLDERVANLARKP